MDYKDIERRLYRLDEVPNNKDIYYPELDEEKITQLKEKSSKRSHEVSIFPYYVRTNEKNYVDIYIFKKDEDYKRIVLQKGYCLSHEDESLFEEIFYKTPIYLGFDIIEMTEEIVQGISEDYPEINLINYRNFLQVFRHIYYTFFESGIKKNLYNHNLCVFATAYNDMKDINLIGKTPQEIMGLPMGMLRAFNSYLGCSLLETKEDRDNMREIYEKYKNVLRRTVIEDKYQWRYISEQYRTGGEIDRSMLNKLRLCYSNKRYNELFVIEEKRRLTEDYYKFTEDELYGNMEKCDAMAYMIEREEIINEMLYERHYMIKHKYLCETKDYVVAFPMTLEELIEISNHLCNWLFTWGFSLGFGDDTFVILKDKSVKYPRNIVLVVEENEIVRVINRGWRKITKKQIRYIEDYARRMKLTIREGATQK